MTKQNPFSVYDFLGYLIPGALIMYSYLIIDYLNKTEFEINDFINIFSNFNFESIFFFIIISYTTGHIASFTSSITVERYAIWRYDYPSKYLLGIETYGVWNKKLKWRNVTKRILIILLLSPCVFFDWVLGHLFEFKIFYTKSLDPFLQKIIRSKIGDLLNYLLSNHEKLITQYKNEKIKEYDFHRIISHYAYEYSRNHQSKMSNYVALYGFLRTLCLILNSLALYFGIRTLFVELIWFNFFAFLFLSLASYISFMAFMKFYRRYTLEGLMVLVVDKDIIPDCATKQKISEP